MTIGKPRPAWRTCARPGCDTGFAPRKIDNLYCCRECQQIARYSKRVSYVEQPWPGGVMPDGAMVCGPEDQRPEIDLRAIPDEGRYWR